MAKLPTCDAFLDGGGIIYDLEIEYEPLEDGTYNISVEDAWERETQKDVPSVDGFFDSLTQDEIDNLAEIAYQHHLGGF